MSERYVCVAELWIQNYDEEGFSIENSYTDIAIGEIWTADNRQHNFVGSNTAIRLARETKWIEIEPDTLKNHFILEEAQE